MSTIKEIENAISQLSPEDLMILRQWFVDFDAKKKAELRTAAWADVNEFRERLAASGRVFGDSSQLVREDREQ